MRPLSGSSLLLYLVTDPRLSKGRTEEEVVGRAVSAGATAVQYRDKGLSTEAMTGRASSLAGICRSAGVPFFVNDRLDVALAARADGVHLGQEDMPPEQARRLAGPDLLIGVSVRTPEEARNAFRDGADYLAANGVFATSTKTGLGPPLGIEGVRQICRATPLPVVGIGGIDARNAGAVIAAGACGVAVVSFIVGAQDIEERCRTMLGALAAAREKGETP